MCDIPCDIRIPIDIPIISHSSAVSHGISHTEYSAHMIYVTSHVTSVHLSTWSFTFELRIKQQQCVPATTTRTQKRWMYTQKRPIYTQKRPIHTQNMSQDCTSGSGVCVCVCVFVCGVCVRVKAFLADAACACTCGYRDAGLWRILSVYIGLFWVYIGLIWVYTRRAIRQTPNKPADINTDMNIYIYIYIYYLYMHVCTYR